jgi:serine protease Do
MNVRVIRRTSVQLLAATSIMALIAGCQISTGSDQGNSSSGADQATTAPQATTATSSNSTTSNTAANTQAVTATAAPTAVMQGTPEAAPALAAPAADFTSAVRDVSQKVKPAVVQITNQQVQFDQYNQPYNVPAGVGSGVIYDDQGHILTNNHVIEGAEQLLVSLPDGRSFPAKLIGADPQTDLAVVQISGDNLPIAKLGDSTKLQVGEWVVAIGNALALPGGPTVTAGVVSALGRTVQEPGSQDEQGNQTSQGPFLFDVIQTSAPINPGNSGGPLMNLAGEVVGINTLVAGQAEPGVPAQGIGFAISIAAAKPIADQLVSQGRAVHTYLGIRYVALNPAIASQLGTNVSKGIVVAQVMQGSPAAKAGLERQDIITAVEGVEIIDESSLAQALSRHKPGDQVPLTVLRGSQQRDVTVTLGELPNP